MITPYELKVLGIKDFDFDKLEKEIDKSILCFHGWYPWEYALIDEEYPTNIRNAIAENYKRVGWNYIYHRTSSEHGDKPGLTSFIFSTEPLDDRYIAGYHKA